MALLPARKTGNDTDPKLTRNATGHMFLRKEQIKIANWE